MKRAQPEPTPTGGVIRTLIVDDSEAVRTSLVAFMAWVPRIKVVGTAGDAIQALTLMTTRRPHLVLLDLNMPVIDGLETMRLLRQRHPTRVIMMAIDDGEEIEKRCRQAGADAFLSKANLCERLEPVVAQLFPARE